MRTTNTIILASIVLASTAAAEDPHCPLLVGHWKPPADSAEAPPVEAFDATVDGRMVVVADVTQESGRLRVLDATDPRNPTEIGWVVLPGDPTSLAMTSGLVAVSHSTVNFDHCVNSGLTLVDISVPSAPRVVSTWEASRYRCTWGVTPFENLVFMVIHGDMVAIDVSDPTGPVEVVRFAPGGEWVNDLEIGQGLLWFAGDDGRLCATDVVDQEGSLEVVCHTVAEGTTKIKDLAVLGHLAAALADTRPYNQGNDLLLLIDIGNAATPLVLSITELPSTAANVELMNGLAAVSVSSMEGVQIFDIRRPLAPVRIGSYLPSPPWMERLTVAGNQMVLAGGGEGVYLLRLDGCQPPRSSARRHAGVPPSPAP